MAVKALVVLTNHDQLGDTGKKTGWYLPELAHPYYIFKDAGYDIVLSTPKGGVAPLDIGSVENHKDEVSVRLLNDEDVMKQLNNTVPIGEVNASEYKVLFFPGGHGPMFDLADNDTVNKVTTQIYESNGVVSAVCHGTVGILNTKLSDGTNLIKDRKVTSFTNVEENFVKLMEAMPFPLETKLIENGAKFSSADLFQEHVVVDDRIITGQNPASASKMAEEVVKKMKSL